MNPIAPLPEIVIERDGIALPAQATIALGEVRVQQRLSLPAQCELTFRDPPGPLEIDLALPTGANIRVLVRGQRIPLFSGQVTAVSYHYEPSGGREVRVRAYDLLHRLRKTGAVRTHVGMSLDDLAREFVSPLGLSVQTDESTPQRSYVIQHRQHDLDLLAEYAERVGMFFALRENTLHLMTLEGITGDQIELALGESLLEASVEINADSVTGEVAASGWDNTRIAAHSGRASNARSGQQVGASVSPGDVGADGALALVDLYVEDDRHAELLAQSELDHRAARGVVLTGTAQGDTRLRPGARVDVDGIARSLKGTYVLTSVTHRVDERLGYVSELSTAPPPRRDRPRATVATPAVVTDIDDPESLGRVRVALPSFENVNTDWINVLSIGAGSGKGLMIQPDVGDDVLVLLAHEDPAQAVVIGGLYAARGTPDTGIEGGAVRRFTLLTPGGQRVKLDDVGQVIRLENSDGSFVELSPEKVSVHAARDLEIEAPGKAIIIRGNTIDFQRG